MRIYMVYNYDYYNPRNGGGIRYTHNLINYLLKNGIKVTLIGVDLSNNKNVVKNSGPDTIYVLKNSDSALKFFIKLFLKAPFLKFEEDAIIHAHRTYFLLPFILFHPKVPKVVTLHMKPLEFVRVEYPQYFKIVDKIHKIIDSFCISHIDGVIAITEEVRSSYIKRYPWLQGKITVIKGTGIDTNNFKPLSDQKRKELRKAYKVPPNSKVILFAGRLTKIKNISFLIRAFKIVANYEPLARLVIAGRGPEIDNLKHLVQELGLEDRVTFLGEVPPEKMPEVYNMADVFALTSLSEASPNVIREALACGIPVVSTNVGDVKEVLDYPLIGQVINSYNEEELANALIRILELKEKKSKIIRKFSIRKIIRYSLERIVEEYIRTYHTVKTHEKVQQ